VIADCGFLLGRSGETIELCCGARWAGCGTKCEGLVGRRVGTAGVVCCWRLAPVVFDPRYKGDNRDHAEN
jgi:hypothetical protein